MDNDLIFIARWWGLFFVLGIASFPLVWSVFKRFLDFGWGFSKIIGLVVISYIIFLSATLKILPFNTSTTYFVFVFYTLINLAIFQKNKKEITTSIKQRKKVLVIEELLFLIGLTFWSYVRAHQPDIRGLEKFMDYGFINSILNSNFFPPQDMWMAGTSINYYWFGHLLTAVATKLTQIPSYVTYNLMIATIAGLALIGVFSVVSSLLSHLKPKKIKVVLLGATISAILVTSAGNFHTPYFVLKPVIATPPMVLIGGYESPFRILREIFNVSVEKYWYPDATRFIGHNPDIDDKTIHEFPIYSFVVSDLHAHLLNLPIVILYIGLLWNFFSEKEKSKKALSLVIMSFVLGIVIMTNTWDFANYGLVTALSLIILSGKKLIKNALSLGATGVGGILFALPFLVNFSSITEGIKLVHTHSAPWQLAILWGFPAAITIVFLIFLARKKNKIGNSDFFVISLLLSSFILIAIPEIIYVKDIYAASHYRANTMFKLTYQAFVMSYLTSGYIFIRTFSSIKKLLYKYILITGYLLLASSILVYPYFAIRSYYGKLETYYGLSGETWLEKQYPSTHQALIWLRKNVVGQPVILEAPGDSYTDHNVISSYSGFPTVQGWFVHEWLWRGKAEIPQERVNVVQEIYTSSDLNQTKELLDRYKVEYIIVGAFEHQKYPNINEKKFNELGKLVFSAEQSRIYKVTR